MCAIVRRIARPFISSSDTTPAPAVVATPSYLAPARYDTHCPNRDHVFSVAAREPGNDARRGDMVERCAGWIEPCSLKAASEVSTHRGHYRASAVAPRRKWPCRNDRLRSAEFGYGGEDAPAVRNRDFLSMPGLALFNGAAQPLTRPHVSRWRGWVETSGTMLCLVKNFAPY
jgi:hypothetical protein